MQFRRSPNLFVEPLDGIRCAHLVLRKDFDRHFPIHCAVFALEHFPHTASTDAVKNNVLAEDQTGDLPLANSLGLKFGQLACFGEFLGHRFRVGGDFSGDCRPFLYRRP